MGSRRREGFYCPICGKHYDTHNGGCDPKILKRIDTRRKSERNMSDHKEPFWLRLRHGFEAMRLSDDSIDAKYDED